MHEIFKKIRRRLLNKKRKKLEPLVYIRKKFKLELGYDLNLDNPKSFNEKLQWMKFNYRDPLMTICSDKVLVKEYVKKIVGEKYLIPTIAIYDKTSDINFALLPKQFVIKCNHNSGKGMIICKDKSKLDYEEARRKINLGLKEDYYLSNYEWPYKNINRKIIAEEYIGDNNGLGLNDYKFYCFNGIPKFFLVSSNRMTKVRFDYFDIDKNPLPFKQGGESAHVDLSRLKNYEEMLMLAKALCKDFPHVRVDLYNIDGKIYFGELTFFDSAGFGKFTPTEWDYKFGDAFVLPEAILDGVE